jgi:hypothetical protein
MSTEDELNALQQIAAALKPLDEQARVRVLQWAFGHFGGGSSGNAASAFPTGGRDSTSGGQRFETFAELFEAAQPSTDWEKALVASYWAQVCQSQPSFASQALNDSLKNLGHGVSNITDALTTLKEDRPALILQLKKSGTSQQARKTYKLTQEGIRRVQSLISRDTSPGSNE